MYVCSSLLEIFHWYGNVTFASKVLQIQTCLPDTHGHWALNVVLCMCTYCDTTSIFKVFAEDPWHLYFFVALFGRGTDIFVYNNISLL